jgi:hypothetical protein
VKQELHERIGQQRQRLRRDLFEAAQEIAHRVIISAPRAIVELPSVA